MREFRSGRSLAPLAFWAFLAMGAILLLWDPAFGGGPLLTRILCGSLILALFLLGPVSAGLHALRCGLQKAVIDPERGLLLPTGRLVPWKALRAVRFRPGPFQKIQAFGDRDPEDDLDTFDVGVFVLWAAQAVWALLYCLLLPAFAVLSPWHGRVTLDLADGSALTFHDLFEEQAFVAIVKIGLGGRKDHVTRIARACARP